MYGGVETSAAPSNLLPNSPYLVWEVREGMFLFHHPMCHNERNNSTEGAQYSGVVAQNRTERQNERAPKRANERAKGLFQKLLLKRLSMPKSLRKIIIYTDGSCNPNLGVGGWGVLFRDLHTDKTRELKGGKEHTTAQEMELTAVLQALEQLKYPCDIKIYTDSQYVQKGITEWIERWRLGNWKKRIKHKHKWKRLYELNLIHEIEWIWVPAHTGIEGNECANDLAIAARREKELEVRHAQKNT